MVYKKDKILCYYFFTYYNPKYDMTIKFLNMKCAKNLKIPANHDEKTSSQRIKGLLHSKFDK